MYECIDKPNILSECNIIEFDLENSNIICIFASNIQIEQSDEQGNNH